ncbi:hypothetical protein [Sphingorhabdus sp. EL138]|uniref:hypothetical protein n=1 Tax=Sphingorhabdus sp. EL138 TaxID=2073156 RepID=UPI0025FE2416|nr:hypothetical protein [Sphingorhabdus sp. EL138]
MFDLQSDSDVTDQIHTFDVPIKLTRAQLEKMLRAVASDVDDVKVQSSPAETGNALTAMAVKKAQDLIEITKRQLLDDQRPFQICVLSLTKYDSPS